MKYFTTIIAVGLLTAVAASPVPAEPPNIEVPLDFVPIVPSVDEGEVIVQAGPDEGAKKRSEPLEKRDLWVDIWEHADRGGRHEALFTIEQRCYNLGNGWNDLVSSLSVPGGKGCTFYRNNGCGPGDVRITVGGTFVNLRDYNWNEWNFNDLISSYLCWSI